MRVLVHAYLIIILCLLLCLLLGFGESLEGESIEWFRLSERSSTVVVLYDAERDGFVETVAINGYIYIYGSEAPSGAYPFKASIDKSEELCLFLYNPIGGSMSAICPSGHRRLGAPLLAVPKVFPTGFMLSNIIYTNGSIYFTPVAKAGSLLEVPEGVGVVGVYNETIVLHVIRTGEIIEVYPIPLDVVAGFYSNETGILYVAISTSDDTLILEYNLTSRTILKYPTPLGIGRTIQSVATKYSIFLLTEAGFLYRFKPGERPVLIDSGDVVFYPAENLNSFTLKSKGRIVHVVDEENETRVDRIQIPEDLGLILSCDWWGPIVAVTTENGVYISSTEEIEVKLDAPRQVYAGEQFNITVTGSYETAIINVSGYTLLYKGSFSTSLSLPNGEHWIRVRACKGPICRMIEHYIYVAPRPLKIYLNYTAVAEPYQDVDIFVDVIDLLTGERARTSCVLEESSGRVKLLVSPGNAVTVPAIPDIDSSVYTVSCGGGEYARSIDVVRIKLERLPYRASLKYKGMGTLEIQAYNVYTGEQWRHGLAVRVNSVLFKGESLVEALLNPGENRIDIYLVIGEREVFLEEIVVTYYEDVSALTPTEEVLVADRVETVTTTVLKPVFLPEPIEVERPDPLVTFSAAVLSAGATYALLTLISRSRKQEQSGQG